MLKPLFIGDRISAAGFRLGGADVLSPVDGEELAAFHHALETHNPVILSAALAATLPPHELETAQKAASPWVIVIGDVRGQASAPDIATRLHRHLGMAE